MSSKNHAPAGREERWGRDSDDGREIRLLAAPHVSFPLSSPILPYPFFSLVASNGPGSRPLNLRSGFHRKTDKKILEGMGL